MADVDFFVFVFLCCLVSVTVPNVECSELNQVYAFPPASMQEHEHQNATAETTQTFHAVKPPEILLRHTLLERKNNLSQPVSNHSTQNNVKTVDKHAGVNPPNGQHYPSSFASQIPVNTNNAFNHLRTTFASLPPLQPNLSRPPMRRQDNFHPNPISNVNPNPNFPPQPHMGPIPNGTALPPTFHQGNNFNSFNEVEQFANFVPLDYENGQMSGIIPPHKREARGRGPPTNRRNGRGPPPPRRSRRRDSKNIRQPSLNQQHNDQSRIDFRFNPSEEARHQNGENPMSPPITDDHSFTAALNTFAQILQQNQYIPMLGARERVRALSQEESKHLDSRRRRDRNSGRGRRPGRRRYPRRRRPHHRDRYPYEEDAPKHHYNDEDDHYDGKHRFPKHFDDDFAPHKDHGPPYKSFKGFKSFKPWKPRYESYDEDHEDHYRGHKDSNAPTRKPAWYPDSQEMGQFRPSGQYFDKAPSHPRPKHHNKYKEYKEYSPESYYEGTSDTEGLKTIKPYYGGVAKFKDWDEKKMKFHKVVDYDHGVIGGVDQFGSTSLKSKPSIVKDDDARMPKIIINHHHNLPPASTGASYVPGAYPANAVLSYTPPIHHFHEDFYSGPGPGGRRNRKKPDYPRSNEFADSFIVNDYGKPPLPSFGMPPPGFGVHPHSHPQHHPPAGPPPPGGANPHMVFDHFARNMPSHFMQGKLPNPNMNQGPFGPHAHPGPHGHPGPHAHPGPPPPVSFSNSHFPGGPAHFPNHAPGFPPMGHPSDSMDPFGKPIASQMGSFNDMPEPHFHPQSGHPEHFEGPPPPPGLFNEPPPGGPTLGSFNEMHSGRPPLPDASPFPSTNEQHHNSPEFIPPFTPVPTHQDAIPPTQGPITPASKESFFRMKSPRPKVPSKFKLTLTKSLNAGFDIPDKLTNHPLAQKKPTPMMNYFDIGVPDREHYKKKQQRNKDNNSQGSSREDHRSGKQSTLPSINNRNKVESGEFNYSTLPENWNNYRPDPSHKKLPSLTHDSSEIGSSRMYKIRSALNPKGIMNAIINRFPRVRPGEKGTGRAHTKFTPFDAVSREDVSSSTSRRRRKSTKAPASIQDIIDSDSSNHNKVVSLSDDELSNNGDPHEGGASSSSPVIIVGRGHAKKRKVAKARKGGSNEMQTEMPFNGEVDDDVLLGMHNINIPVQAEIRMGEVQDDDVKKKK